MNRLLFLEQELQKPQKHPASRLRDSQSESLRSRPRYNVALSKETDDDVDIAKKLLDRYRETLFCNQYLQPQDVDPGIADLAINTDEYHDRFEAATRTVFQHKSIARSIDITLRSDGRQSNQIAYWIERGKLVEKKLLPIKSLRCADSAALAIKKIVLNSVEKFTSSLAVIKQGNPASHGHWYVIAGTDNAIDALNTAFGPFNQQIDTFIRSSDFSLAATRNEWNRDYGVFPLERHGNDFFVIDVWGECLKRDNREPSGSVIAYKPAFCYFDTAGSRGSRRPRDTNKMSIECRVSPREFKALRRQHG